MGKNEKATRRLGEQSETYVSQTEWRERIEAFVDEHIGMYLGLTKEILWMQARFLLQCLKRVVFETIFQGIKFLLGNLLELRDSYAVTRNRLTFIKRHDSYLKYLIHKQILVRLIRVLDTWAKNMASFMMFVKGVNEELLKQLQSFLAVILATFPLEKTIQN